MIMTLNIQQDNINKASNKKQEETVYSVYKEIKNIYKDICPLNMKNDILKHIMNICDFITIDEDKDIIQFGILELGDTDKLLESFGFPREKLKRFIQRLQD